MKFKIASLFAVVLIVNAATPARAEDLRCSLARAAGNWSVSDSGTVVGVGPRVAVGRFTLDSAGNFLNGVVTSSLNGNIAAEKASGTYTVNSDCTGTLSIQVTTPEGAELFTATLVTAFDNEMKHLRGIFTSVVAPAPIGPLQTAIVADAQKQ